MRTNKRKEEFAQIFSLNLRNAFFSAVQDFDSLQEIRLRADAPMIFRFREGDRYLTASNHLSSNLKDAIMIPAAELKETMEYISNYSLYAYEEEIRKGYLTISGGHRIGIAGKTVCDGNAIRSIKHISFLCIRLAHEIIGCSDDILPYLFGQGGFQDTLILSPPGFGKTTLLRDLIRNLSDGTVENARGYQIGVVDERSEIAACYLGIPQNNVGKRTDVYDACPKEKGIELLLRSMSPQIIAVDELAGESDMTAIERAFGCGCRILATTHAASLQELQDKKQWKDVFEGRMFRRYILINHACNKERYTVCDERGQPVKRERGNE